MGNYTREEILAMAEEEDVEFIPPVYRYVWNSEKYCDHSKRASKSPG